MLATGLAPIPHELRTEDGKHIYTIEGHDHELESVTTNLRVINKENINTWREKLGRAEAMRIKTEGGDIGRMVHSAGLRLFKGEGYGTYEWSQLGHPTPEDERVRNCVCALQLLRQERTLNLLGAEVFVWSQEYAYAGTLDAAVLVENELVAAVGSPAGLAELLREHPEAVAVDLYDWKTSGAVYPEAWLQLGAYAVAFMESYHIPVRRIYPVRLDRGLPTVPHDEQGGPIRSPVYELGQMVPGPDGTKVRQEFMEGDDLMDAFEAYMHAQELGSWTRRYGGRY